ncbi:hypothetical protein WA158_008207 [Blastocystis sp. Blastoise]
MSTRIPQVLVPIANGSEELESIAVIDILRRSKINVTVASVENSKQVVMSRGVQLVADSLLKDIIGNNYDAIVLPGGMPGAEHLRDCEDLINKLNEQNKKNQWICAICASPAVVLQQHGFLSTIKATSFPNFQKNLSNPITDKQVVIDKNFITSQGPGTAIPFALEIVNQLQGTTIMNEVKKGLLV